MASVQPWSRLHQALLSRASQRVAVVVLLVVALMPPEGLGVDLCWLHATTGLPCPGCGMTRGLSALLRGDVARAVGLHPFTLLALPGLLGLSVLAVLPAGVSGRVVGALDGVPHLVSVTGRLVLFAFLAFGLGRLTAALLGVTL